LTTYIHKVKCTGCGLHFAAYSWRKDWTPESCPECKSSLPGLGYLHWRQESDHQVFEFVPGQAELVGMSVG